MSAQYHLPCPCGQQVIVRLSQAGESVVCECGETLEVPTLRELRSLDPVEPSAKPVRRTVWGRRQMAISVGLVVTMLSLSYLGYLQWISPRRIDVERLSPALTWLLWHELRDGANRMASPAAQEAARSEYSHGVSKVCAIVATSVGVLVMGGAYVLIKPTRVGSTSRAPRQPSEEKTNRQDH